MSIDHNAYIGPYLRVTETVEKREIDRCAKHNFPPDAFYCPKCGCAKKDRYTKEEVSNAPEWWNNRFKKEGKAAELSDYLHTSSMDAPKIKESNGKRTRTYMYLPNR